MRAAIVEKAKILISNAVAKPVLKPQQLLIKVHAFGINRADILQRQGFYPPPPGASSTLGLEVSGEVIEINNENKSDEIKVGSRVMALLGGGGYAEYAAADIPCVIPIPDSLSYIQAAGIMETYITAFQGIYSIGRVKKDDIVLLHAAASGVGTSAIQLCKTVFKAISVVTVGSEDKITYCKSHGAAAGFNYKSGNWSKPLLQFIEKEYNKKGVDIVFDPVDTLGGSYAEQNFEVLGLDSRWISYGILSGQTAIKDFNLGQLLHKRIQLTGTTLRARSIEYKEELIQSFKQVVMPHITNGDIKPQINKVFEFEQAQEAHDYMETNAGTGKIVVKVIS